MDGDAELRTARGLVVPAGAQTWSFARAGGAGGQHVNKTSSKVTLDVDVDAVTGAEPAVARIRDAFPSGLRVTSQTTRSQWRNRQECLQRAGEMLDDAARPPGPARRRSKPTKGSVERRLASKRRDGEKKHARRTTEW
jgi:ribosome-associated protein